MKPGQLIALGLGGFGVWWLGSQLGWWGGIAAPAPAPAPAPTPTPAPALPPAAPSTPAPSASTQVLTVADANTLMYSKSITAAQINAISAQLVSELKAGQVQVINCKSVLMYMLGWGCPAVGTVKSTSGYQYSFDGSNWNLEGPISAATGAAGPFYAAAGK